MFAWGAVSLLVVACFCGVDLRGVVVRALGASLVRIREPFTVIESVDVSVEIRRSALIVHKFT